MGALHQATVENSRLRHELGGSRFSGPHAPGAGALPQVASAIGLDSFLAPDIEEFVVDPELKALLDEGIKLDTVNYRLLVNPQWPLRDRRPDGDAGLTGSTNRATGSALPMAYAILASQRVVRPAPTRRKIIIDAYGGMARHGGGAFSGKDMSKEPSAPPR